MIKVLFFARLRDQLGCSEMDLEINDMDIEKPITNITVLDYLFKKNPEWKEVFEQQNIFVAVNQEIIQSETQLNDNDEVAFFPPVTGG